MALQERPPQQYPCIVHLYCSLAFVASCDVLRNFFCFVLFCFVLVVFLNSLILEIFVDHQLLEVLSKVSVDSRPDRLDHVDELSVVSKSSN